MTEDRLAADALDAWLDAGVVDTDAFELDCEIDVVATAVAEEPGVEAPDALLLPLPLPLPLPSGMPQPFPPAIGDHDGSSPRTQSVIGGEMVSSLSVLYPPFGYVGQPCAAYAFWLLLYWAIALACD